MGLALIYSRAAQGIHAPLVSIEVHLSAGLPALSIVGLPETVVRESKDRVRSAIINSDFSFPMKRITINLAPADLPKEGGRFDLPIAIGILAASNQIPLNNLNHYEIAGELALSGDIRPIRGTLPFALGTNKAKRTLLIPAQNAQEAARLPELTLLPVLTLRQIASHLQNKKKINPFQGEQTRQTFTQRKQPNYLDLNDISEQHHAKRALEIAASGRHSLLMIGPPGTGKTMLASRLPGILPAMTLEESLETAAIHSISLPSGMDPFCVQRPFRNPHHTASAVALVGGGSNPKPGEISLAHHGVLFLDELPQFDQKVLEVLREPLESGEILLSRAARSVTYPAKFQLIAAMNPCPCGYLGDKRSKCQCTLDQIQRYRHKLSGPLLDRIDMHIEVPAISANEISEASSHPLTSSTTVRKRVDETAKHQRSRNQGHYNAQLSNHALKKIIHLDKQTDEFLKNAMDKLRLSARSYHRVLKVARTIADLAQNDAIVTEHVAEALGYRKFDQLAGDRYSLT